MDTISQNTSGMKPMLTPTDCWYCEYDRRFPETSEGGWIYFGNNGPYVSCPICNPKGERPRQSR